MSAPTTTMPKLGPEMTLALEIGEAGKIGDPRKALAMATRAANRYPRFEIPAGQGRTVTFALLRDHFQAEVDKLDAELAEHATGQDSAQAPARTPEPKKPAPAKKAAPAKKPAPRKAAPAKAAPAKAAPKVESVKAEPTVLSLVHDGVSQTAIFGVEKGSPANRVIGSAKREAADGKPGLGWWFFRDNESFYIPGSQGYAPDYVKINEAIGRLEALTGDNGEQLYRVESAIVTEVDGKALPVRKTRDEMQAWQQAYTAAQNLASWEIGMGTAVCVTCLAEYLGEKDARITKGANGMPHVECATCAGVAVAEPIKAEPVVLALPAAPAVAEVESAECPLCHTMQAVKGGKLALHTFNGGACRGKLGVAVVDVEPDEPVKVTRTRKATSKPAVKVAEPEDATGLVVKIQIQRALSKQKQGDVATWMRQAINRQVTKGRKDMNVELRRDKSTGVATITVIDGGGWDRGELETALVAAVKSTPGFGNRVNG
jgi:hypothetical protein